MTRPRWDRDVRQNLLVTGSKRKARFGRALTEGVQASRPFRLCGFSYRLWLALPGVAASRNSVWVRGVDYHFTLSGTIRGLGPQFSLYTFPATLSPDLVFGSRFAVPTCVHSSLGMFAENRLALQPTPTSLCRRSGMLLLETQLCSDLRLDYA